MSDMIKKLYDGEYYAVESALPDNSDCAVLLNMIKRKWDYFSDMLPVNEQDDFEALQLMISELEDKYNFAFFSEGIKVGISLMSEASAR
ncbi:MAG: hypothetical protein IKU18_03530 [Bacteroidales bacterium]|nr:hypothetical protein [Bacteroidales bacterium]